MKILLIIISIVFANLSFGQDMHFSQFEINRLSFNPSLIGDIKNNYNYKVNLQRRSQWKSVSIPFSTIAFSFENKDFWRNFNYGIEFSNDNSGDANLSTSQINLGISKRFKILNNNLAFGGVVGFAQKNIDLSNLIFEESEDIYTNNLYFPDLGFGAAFQKRMNNFLILNSGISFFHVNRPKQSFQSSSSVYLPTKKNLHVSIEYLFSTSFELKSQFLFTSQNPSKESLIRLDPIYKIGDLEMISSIMYRWKDAIILGCGIYKKNVSGFLSYDINISDLNYASKKRGGFEFAIIYIFGGKKKKIIEKIYEICPKYL